MLASANRPSIRHIPDEHEQYVTSFASRGAAGAWRLRRVIGTQTHSRVLRYCVRALAGHAREVSAPRGPRQIVIRDERNTQAFFVFPSRAVVRPAHGARGASKPCARDRRAPAPTTTARVDVFACPLRVVASTPPPPRAMLTMSSTVHPVRVCLLYGESTVY